MAAMREHRPVDQKLLQRSLPHVTPSALNSRVARVRKSITNPQPKGPVTPTPLTTVMTSTQEPLTTTATTTQAVSAADVQAAMDLAAIGDEAIDQASEVLEEMQDQDVEMDVGLDSEHVEQEQAAIDQANEVDEELEALKTRVTALTEEVTVARSELDAARADFLSREAAQDEDLLTSAEAVQDLKTKLVAAEGDIADLRSQLEAAKKDLASKDATIQGLRQENHTLRAGGSLLVVKRRLEEANKTIEERDKTIETLKKEKKTARDHHTVMLKATLATTTATVKANYQGEIDDLKNYVASLKLQNEDLQRRHDDKVASLHQHISDLERELRYTRWVTALHKYLVSVEEDMKVLTDSLTISMDSLDRVMLYSPYIRMRSVCHRLHAGSVLCMHCTRSWIMHRSRNSKMT